MHGTVSLSLQDGQGGSAKADWFFFLKTHRGFSLVEIAVVLTILGLILAGSVSSYNAYIDNAYQNSTEGKLEQTKRALLDYVMVNYHMPCPDTDGDGSENRDGDDTCTASIGEVPYNDIGRSLAGASDEWGNVFDYGVNSQVNAALDVTSNDNMAFLENVSDVQEMEGMNEASYFANQDVLTTADGNKSSVSAANAISLTMPLFSLRTPVTSVDVASTTSYRVCKRNSSNPLCTVASDFEVQSIPAVLVAFNENGNGVSLNDCNSQARSQQETENCNGDLALMRGTFNETLFDDQIFTISAYEIKQQVLDRLNQFTLNSGPSGGGGGVEWDSFTYILNKEFSSTNELNAGSGADDHYLVTGSINSNGSVNMQGGNNIIAVLGDISVSNVINGSNSDVDLLLLTADDYPTAQSMVEEMEEHSDLDYVCDYDNLTSCYSANVTGNGNNATVTAVPVDFADGQTDTETLKTMILKVDSDVVFE